MSHKAIPKRLRRWLEGLGDRCEYCRTSERITAIVLDGDHIMPRAKGGPTNQANLCRACSACNTNKSDQTEALDPETNQLTALFHPRRQSWPEHFAWSADGAEMPGLTACGRATIIALKLNHPRLVRARRLWVSVG